jgi:hypothetical protein
MGRAVVDLRRFLLIGEGDDRQDGAGDLFPWDQRPGLASEWAIGFETIARPEPCHSPPIRMSYFESDMKVLLE